MEPYLLQEAQKNVEPLIQQALNWVVNTTGRQITYAREYEDSVGKLKQLPPSWVDAEVDKAIRRGEDIDMGEAEKLKEREKEIMAQAQQVAHKFDMLDEINGFTCCWCVPNVWRQYRVGRKARICFQKFDAFRTQDHSNVIGVEIPPGEVNNDSWINSVKPKACELQSRVDVMNKIIHVLEDESSELVGLWGPEGAGKSMLINQVLYRVNKQKNLQRVRVRVPQKQQDATELEKEIQKQIVEKISPDWLDKFKELEKRAEQIRKWFNSNREKKAVIILDDLPQKINLDKIGIPNNEKKVCDVILTARDMDLLVNDMGLSRERTFEVGPLSQKESTKLFLYNVRRAGQTIDEEKKSVARELVKYCGGLPKLIEQQACILTNHLDIYAWHDAMREIKSQNAKKMLVPVKEILSTWSSNDNDQKEIRSLFSICGLFGESSSLVGELSILVRDLIIHCRALDIFTDDVTVKETKDRVKRLLHILRARSLVRGTNHEVKITELLRDVAALIASEEKYLCLRNDSSYKRSESIEKQLQECTALSIDGLDVLKEHPKLKYDNLKMLHLVSRHHSLEIGDEEFFKRMEKLRGLYLKHIDFKSACFPSIDKNLENLQTLCLDDCWLRDVRPIGQLTKLQILRISKSDIVELPKDVGNLTDLRMLDLRGCRKLQVIEYGVLSNLKRLEELYLDENFDQWEVRQQKLGPSRRKASLNELNEMNLLSTLYVYVPKSTMLPESLKLEQLEKYKILVGEDFRNCSEVNVKVRTLRLNLSDSTSILWEEEVKRMMHRIESLYLKGATRMPKPSIHRLCSQGFPSLSDLHLENCGFQYIVESSELDLAFPNLETLTLVNLKNLRKVCIDRLKGEPFGRLKSVIVEKCHALENLFDFSVMERVSTLNKIEVKDCKKIKGIVTGNDTEHDGGTSKRIIWDKLRHLSLENLPVIISFRITRMDSEEPTAFFDGDLDSFPGLERLWLVKLSMVRNIWHQNIPLSEFSNLQELTVKGSEEASHLKDILFYSANTTPKEKSALQKPILGFSCVNAQVGHGLQNKTLKPDGHQNLRRLIVHDCGTLEFLFTPSMAQALPYLTELEIASCEMMKEVIKVDNGVNGELFKDLTTLCLVSLENLITFSNGSISDSFPSLKRLEISGCHKLTALFTDSKDDGNKEEICSSLFHGKESPSFPLLDNLVILNMNKLIRVWEFQEYRHATSSQHGGKSGGSSSNGSASKLWKTFLNIKKLDIIDCASLEKILDVKGSLDVENNDKCHDAQLNEVNLEDLKKMKYIWGRNGPEGRKIHYRNLEIVSLRRCQGIESLFPASMVDDLLRLQSLKVKSCGTIKHLIGEDNSSSENNAPQFFFPDVKILELQELPELMTFYHGPHCSEWPSLEQLTVSKCDKIKIFGKIYGFEYKKSKALKQDLNPEGLKKAKDHLQTPSSTPKQASEDSQSLSFASKPASGDSQPPSSASKQVSGDPQPSSSGSKQASEDSQRPSSASKQASDDSQTLFLVSKDSFCRLSTLELSQNLSMKKMWGDLNHVDFRKLKVLKLISSGKEPVILPVTFLLKSPHLESLQVDNHCFLINMTKTPNHEHAQKIPKMTRSLSKVELSKIPEMTDLKEALDCFLGVSSSTFRWLTSLKVSNCDSLEYLFTYSTAECLGRLTMLTIANCEKMKVVVASEKGETKDKEIVTSDEGRVKDEAVILHKLECLTLDSLKGLTCFCEESYTFRFPSLGEVTVRECSEMMRFTHGETSSPNLIKVDIKGKKIDLPDERNLNKIIK